MFNYSPENIFLLQTDSSHPHQQRQSSVQSGQAQGPMPPQTIPHSSHVTIGFARNMMVSVKPGYEHHRSGESMLGVAASALVSALAALRTRLNAFWYAWTAEVPSSSSPSTLRLTASWRSYFSFCAHCIAVPSSLKLASVVAIGRALFIAYNNPSATIHRLFDGGWTSLPAW